MSKKVAALQELLADLTRESDEVDGAIEEMMAEMAATLPAHRSTGDWAPDGKSTKRFLELTNRQAELEAEIELASRALAEVKGPPPSTH
jgi:roadblock/LC7 domain-containing protein